MRFFNLKLKNTGGGTVPSPQARSDTQQHGCWMIIYLSDYHLIFTTLLKQVWLRTKNKNQIHYLFGLQSLRYTNRLKYVYHLVVLFVTLLVESDKNKRMCSHELTLIFDMINIESWSSLSVSQLQRRFNFALRWNCAKAWTFRKTVDEELDVCKIGFLKFPESIFVLSGT